MPETVSNPLEIASEVNKRLSATSDVYANIRSALECINGCMGFSRSFLLLAEAGNDAHRIAAAAGLNAAEFRRIEAKVGHTTLREVLQEGKILRESTDESDCFDEVLRKGAELIAVPVAFNGKVLGSLAAIADKGVGREAKICEALLCLTASMISQSLRIEHAVRGERERLREENTHLKNELKERYEFSNIIGTSGEMKQVYEQVSQVAKTNATVLLRGESGTGKEMIANAIHYNSLRSKRPFIKINCAALPETLIESELFGHEKGAFTGADRFKKGRFEMADGGTLFLDEIGDLPLQTQIKLLRVLQEREFERIGALEPVKTNIRLITATHKNLEKAIEKGEFREDLYYRLNVFTIFLPPLRERKTDLLLLAEHFLEKYEKEHNKRIRRISTPAIDMLMSYHFPGNVRELENAIERAVLACDSNVIHGHHLPPTLQTAEITDTVTDFSLSAAVAAFERDMIQDALKSTRGSVAKAAKALASTERILGYKIRKYGIEPRRFRS
ncbi:MAG TPA: sigma-54-dependent Fis family transcriptional regulator [Blastocatellia bacterium]|nr:sigma-54-dependent Fis family transcriptional regulator [Blastocatellia bacterium]